MITKTMMLIAISVGIMMRRRWTIEPNMSLSGRRDRSGSGRGRLLVAGEPEGIRMVDAKMRARIPIVDALDRNVAQLVADDNGLRDAGDEADAQHLIGMDGQQRVPDPVPLFRRVGIEPAVEQAQQLARDRHVRRLAGAPPGLRGRTPSRPMPLPLGGR